MHPDEGEARVRVEQKDGQVDGNERLLEVSVSRCRNGERCLWVEVECFGGG